MCWALPFRTHNHVCTHTQAYTHRLTGTQHASYYHLALLGGEKGLHTCVQVYMHTQSVHMAVHRRATARLLWGAMHTRHIVLMRACPPQCANVSITRACPPHVPMCQCAYEGCANVPMCQCAHEGLSPTMCPHPNELVIDPSYCLHT